jgi:hypothetical protein
MGTGAQTGSGRQGLVALVVVALAGMAGLALAASQGSADLTYSETRVQQVVEFAWKSRTNGSATAATKGIAGKVERVAFIAVAPFPTTVLTAKVCDAYGYDILNGAGAGLATDVNSTVTTTNGAVIPFDGVLTLTITNAGAADKQGKVVLWFR